MGHATLRKLLIATLSLVLTSSLFAGQKDIVPVTVLHWNDMHAHNVPQPREVDGDTLWIGGAATLGGYLNHYRATMPNVLTLNAGDDFQGTPISTLTKGKSQIELLNVLKPDAFEVGNHEFDYG